jgi:hypothetical protein
MMNPLRQEADLPPAIPDLSNLQTKDDFLRPSLNGNGQGKGSRVCRSTLLPRAELQRRRKRKSDEIDRRAFIIESCSLIAEENILTDISDKVAECQIDLPSMIPDGVSLSQRCRSLKPRNS